MPALAPRPGRCRLCDAQTQGANGSNGNGGATPVSVTAKVTGLDTNSKLTPHATISNVTVGATSNNTRYTVATEAFASGQEYTLAIAKAGYNIPGVTFTPRRSLPCLVHRGTGRRHNPS